MGEVYRARDTKLKRDVAVKVLPETFASDPDRLWRFSREATTLAALNHPNIAHIHGLEESGHLHALVMELVEGDDLSKVIARGPMPLAEAVAIARQLTDALESAHEQNIVHRDLETRQHQSSTGRPGESARFRPRQGHGAGRRSRADPRRNRRRSRPA